jgi:hypothetical protein
MRRAVLLAFVLVVAAAGAAFARAGGGHAGSFRLADASAACRVEGAALVCRSLAAPAGLSLPARGAPRAAPEPGWWDASPPVLRHGSRGGISCRADGGAILCTNASGATISLGPHQIAVAA